MEADQSIIGPRVPQKIQSWRPFLKKIMIYKLETKRHTRAIVKLFGRLEGKKKQVSGQL